MKGVEEVRLDWASDHYLPTYTLRRKSRKWEYVVLLHT